MPVVLSETATYDATVTVPADGDSANAASVAGAFQALADRTKYLNSVFAGITFTGGFVGERRAYCASVGGNVVIPPIRGLLIGGGVVSTSVQTAFTGTGRTANTWYYLYGYNGGGTLLFETSTDGPDESCVYKLTGGVTLDPTRRFVTCFKTDSSGNVLPFRMVHGDYAWRVSAMAANSAFIAANVANTSYTDMSLAAWMPPHARVARLRVGVTVGASGVQYINIVAKGDVGLTAAGVSQAGAAGTLAYGAWEQVTDSAQTIQYACNAGGNGTATVYIDGFRE